MTGGDFTPRGRSCSPQLVTGGGALAVGCTVTQPPSPCPAESGRLAGAGGDEFLLWV